MKQDIEKLRDQNQSLIAQISDISHSNEQLGDTAKDLREVNVTLLEKVHTLEEKFEALQLSEKDIRTKLDELSSKFENSEDIQALRKQLEDLTKAQQQVRLQVEEILDSLKEPVQEEKTGETLPDSGIFSYFVGNEEAQIFIEKVEDAIAQELTYAQIDVFLTKHLPAELDAILKDHPSLTKQYIRNRRNN